MKLKLAQFDNVRGEVDLTGANTGGIPQYAHCRWNSNCKVVYV